MSAPARQRAAIVFADAGGHGAMGAGEKPGARARFDELTEEIVKPLVKQYRGRLVKSVDETLVMTFTSAVAAASFAIDVQRTLPVHQSQWPEGQRLRFRVGVALGDIIVEGDEVRGGGIDVASGLQSMAEPGGVLMSGTIFDPAHRRLDHVAFEDLGLVAVAHWPEPVQAYNVLLDPSAVARIAKGPSIFSRPRVATALLTLVILAGAALWKLRPWE